MLKLYDADTFDWHRFTNVVHDIEEAFRGIHLVSDDITRELLKYIEQAEFYDEFRVVDRFGTCIYTSEISTGCKAALCVHYLKDKIIDLRECGVNARDFIVLLCNEGNAIFYYADLTINQERLSETKVDICMNGRHFTDVLEFNKYLRQGLEGYYEVFK